MPNENDNAARLAAIKKQIAWPIWPNPRADAQWLLGEIERLQRYEAMWEDCRQHRDKAEKRARRYMDLYEQLATIVQEFEGEP
jgi:hypothetical protein